jgi:hypothetical protein
MVATRTGKQSAPVETTKKRDADGIPKKKKKTESLPESEPEDDGAGPTEDMDRGGDNELDEYDDGMDGGEVDGDGVGTNDQETDAAGPEGSDELEEEENDEEEDEEYEYAPLPSRFDRFTGEKFPEYLARALERGDSLGIDSKVWVTQWATSLWKQAPPEAKKRPNYLKLAAKLASEVRSTTDGTLITSTNADDSPDSESNHEHETDDDESAARKAARKAKRKADKISAKLKKPKASKKSSLSFLKKLKLQKAAKAALLTKEPIAKKFKTSSPVAVDDSDDSPGVANVTDTAASSTATPPELPGPRGVKEKVSDKEWDRILKGVPTLELRPEKKDKNRYDVFEFFHHIRVQADRFKLAPSLQIELVKQRLSTDAYDICARFFNAELELAMLERSIIEVMHATYFPETEFRKLTQSATEDVHAWAIRVRREFSRVRPEDRTSRMLAKQFIEGLNAQYADARNQIYKKFSRGELVGETIDGLAALVLEYQKHKPPPIRTSAPALAVDEDAVMLVPPPSSPASNVSLETIAKQLSQIQETQKFEAEQRQALNTKVNALAHHQQVLADDVRVSKEDFKKQLDRARTQLNAGKQQGSGKPQPPQPQQHSNSNRNAKKAGAAASKAQGGKPSSGNGRAVENQ